MLCADCLEHAHPFRDHFPADAVAGDHCYRVLFGSLFHGREYIESAMRFAAIETSTEWCSAAVWVDGEITAVERRAGHRHSELALPMLEELFNKTDTKPETLDAIAFGAGPGSFTGLRIACGLAQGLALPRGLPVIGIPTLEALAEECAADRVVACLDARMREVYYAAFEKAGGRWREVVPVQCMAPDAAPPPPGDGWTGCGNGFAVFPGFLRNKIASMKSEIHPSAVAVARLAAPRLAAGEGLDAALAAPLYIRDKVALTAQEVAAR
jgi:tRNA threonylcarbamoyladenosine biosynthesis protein TsaB